MDLNFVEYNPSDDEEIEDVNEDTELEESNDGEEYAEEPVEETDGEQQEEQPEEDDYLQRWSEEVKSRQNQNVDDVPNVVMKTLERSQLMKDVLYWQTQGRTDDEILAGMGKLYAQRMSQQQPQQQQNEYDQPQEQQVNIRQIIADEIQKAINPLGSKVQAMESQQYVNTVSNYNDNMLKQTMAQYGINEPLDQEDFNKMKIVLNTALGRLNIQKDYMTKAEAEILVEKGLNHKMKKKQQITTRGNQSKEMPQIAGSEQRTMKQQGNTKPRTDGLNKSERKARLLEFL